jgi:replication factor C subunit 3/5
MTLQAQNALRRIIEKYTRNVRFCIICNYINKLSPAIQSRTTKFRFSPLTISSISSRLDHIIESENVNITEAGKQALLKLSSGDMRRAVNVLQACSSAYDLIDDEEVYMCVGMIMPADTERIVQSMLSEEFGTCLQCISILSELTTAINTMKQQKGLALQDILGAVYEALQELELAPQTRIYILDLLATIEYRLSMGGTERIQVSAMVAGIKTAIDLGAK